MRKREKKWDHLSGWLTNAFEQYKGAVALEFGEMNYSYGELDQASRRIAGFLLAEKKEEKFIGVYGTKEFFTYAVIAGIIRAGKAYVPLNPKFPPARNLEILKLSGSGSVAGNFNSAGADPLPGFSGDILGADLLDRNFNFSDVPLEGSAPAYLLFTSGSTGQPKGVMITHRQVIAYLENIEQWTALEPGHKCSHTFDLTFDLSVHDIFYTLSHGATLCVPEANELLSPASYIRNRNITHWFSVPSLGGMMDKLRQLKEDSFPVLQKVLFCGEALPVGLAVKFSRAAVNADVVNLYGPTEATIAVSAHDFTASPLQRNGNVSIGKIFEENHFLIDQSPDEFQESTKGELLVSGEQVIGDYFFNPQPDEEAFFREKDGRAWYRTGDIVELDEENNLFFVGRKDTQVKLHGYRIELGEIESVLRAATGNSSAVCFIKETGGAFFIAGVLEGEKRIENDQLIKRLKERLPPYMIPQQIVYLHSFPLNVNGKVDRRAIENQVKND